MAKKTSGSLGMVIIAVIAASFLGDSINGFNPVLENILEAFPHLSYTAVTFVSTIPNVTFIFAALIVGAIVGKRMKYRTAIITGCALILLGGVAPAVFYQSFSVLLVSRLVFGLGLGTLVVINGYVTSAFDGKRRQQLLGWHVTSMNIGSVAVLLIAGALGEMHWHVAAYSYVLAIIPLVAAFFIKEPQEIRITEEAPAEEDTIRTKTGFHIEPAVIGYGIVIIIMTMALYGLLLIMSPYVVDNNLGSSFQAGLLLSVYTAGAAFGGLVYDVTRRAFKGFFMQECVLQVIAGVALFYYANAIVLIAVGSFIAGWAWYAIMNVMTEFAAKKSNEETMAFNTSIIWISSTLGCFIGSFWMTGAELVFGDLYFGVVMAIFITFAAVGLFFMFRNPLKDETAGMIGGQHEYN